MNRKSVYQKAERIITPEVGSCLKLLCCITTEIIWTSSFFLIDLHSLYSFRAVCASQCGCHSVSDSNLRMENGERLGSVQGDQDPHQELLMLWFEGQSKAIYDTGGVEGEKRRAEE